MYWYDIINNSTNTSIDYWKKDSLWTQTFNKKIAGCCLFNVFWFHEFKYFLLSCTFVKFPTSIFYKRVIVCTRFTRLWKFLRYSLYDYVAFEISIDYHNHFNRTTDKSASSFIFLNSSSNRTLLQRFRPMKTGKVKWSFNITFHLATFINIYNIYALKWLFYWLYELYGSYPSERTRPSTWVRV